MHNNKATQSDSDKVKEFYLKHYCQKVLPATYREVQKEYLGNKGMTLHANILLLKENKN